MRRISMTLLTIAASLSQGASTGGVVLVCGIQFLPSRVVAVGAASASAEKCISVNDQLYRSEPA